MSEPRKNPWPWETSEWHAWEAGWGAGSAEAIAQERERLRVAVTLAFDEYLWGLFCSPGGEACEASVSFFRDTLLAALLSPDTGGAS